MMPTPSMRSLMPAAFLLAAFSVPAMEAQAQAISFEGDLPRTMVFIQEEGRGKVAAREMTSLRADLALEFWEPYLDGVRNQIEVEVSRKLRQLVFMGATISEPVLKEAYVENNTRINLTYVRIRPTSFYDKDFGPEQAHRLFRLTLFRLAGLDAPSAAEQGSA